MPTKHLSIVFPFIFIVLYGSGFVGAKVGLPFSPPGKFLLIRFLIASVILAGIALALKSKWPNKLHDFLHIAVAGSLTSGTFSIAAFFAIEMGISPALSALIISLQPIFVSIIAQQILGEDIRFIKWLGLSFGFLGILFVVGQQIDLNSGNLFSLLLAFVALFGVSAGNLYQKRFCSNMNIFTGGSIQALVSAFMTAPIVLLFENQSITWSFEFVCALLYMSIGVSVGALSFLYVLIRRGEISQVASLFYFVPISTAIMSAIVFQEMISVSLILGIGITSVGIILVNQQNKAIH